MLIYGAFRHRNKVFPVYRPPVHSRFCFHLYVVKVRALLAIMMTSLQKRDFISGFVVMYASAEELFPQDYCVPDKKNTTH